MDHRLSERDVPLPGFAYQKQRYFTDHAINTALDSALARVDPDTNTVVLRGKVDENGGALVLAVRPNKVWTVGAVLGYEKRAGWGLGFEIKAQLP